MHSKPQRVEEILRRLMAAPPADSDEAALALLADVTNAVEDELSGVPYDAEEATMLVVSKRMYPPLPECKNRLPLQG